MPPLVLNPKKRVPLLKTQTRHTDPEPTLPIKQSKTHPGQSKTPSSSSGHEGSVFFIGTATTLICYHGIRILTDPNFLRTYYSSPPSPRDSCPRQPATAILNWQVT